MSLKKAYLYLVSTISIVIWVIGAIMLVNMALKAWVFTKADQNYYSVCYSAVTRADGKTGECTAEEEAKQKKQEEENSAAQKQRDAAQALSMMLVALPVWFFHWRLAKREV